ncbi:MAG: ATP-binding protein, partial [Kiritimatiellae bacterium]|nr:ATP-binding protein [Kiritimatiellia bacterium]
MSDPVNFELPGAFYLGRLRDPSGQTTTDAPLIYPAKDLTTHAVCVGMTGSGKTGLGVTLVEEAALDGIPVILIDPKGDLANLLLTFPDLDPADFQPWLDPDELARKGLTPEQGAEKTASTWRKGLASWGEDGDRIARLRAAADFSIYTPGAKTGLSLSLLSSLDAPPPGFADDPAAMRDRVSAAVSGVLALAGIDADPVQSREHILLSALVDRDWRDGRSVDLARLIQTIQEPGLDRIGVLPLESFFPAKDRFALAMRLNNLMASPSFAAWTEGEPLDISRLLRTPDGRPRVTVLSIAHLQDAERMFFVTVLLNEVLAWARRQSGTSSLRAILYMDEIFGYFPPNANPPSKAPMLTLLKQARAYGLGIVLATQNPVDLDYRGLANTGTWFIGRLQTERDKMRVIEGLTSAVAGEGLDRATLDRLMANLKQRVFMMRNAHDDAPVLFESRWCMSYLRGPLSPAEISRLMAHKKALASPASPAPAAPAPAVVSQPSHSSIPSP